ncbi:hypothetical protein PQO01_04800 [Lentisphaera marina]|uniref:hypothetical protein n=1 Tax=Lentisphaera marina TaxID=1111041 RepID=UPI00236708E5|nr:hypothetical protein [Lentisphaera marina]MDD7984264.1 hypothetical protein [Lentisphaera marina]
MDKDLQRIQNLLEEIDKCEKGSSEYNILLYQLKIEHITLKERDINKLDIESNFIYGNLSKFIIDLDYVDEIVNKLEKESLNYQRIFSKQEYEKILNGYKATSQDEKWNITTINDWTYLQRSWTSFYIYGFQLINEGDQYSVKQSWVNRNKDQYGNTDLDYDRKSLNIILETQLNLEQTK